MFLKTRNNNKAAIPTLSKTFNAKKIFLDIRSRKPTGCFRPERRQPARGPQPLFDRLNNKI